jgi:hypothetical protein
MGLAIVRAILRKFDSRAEYNCPPYQSSQKVFSEED